MKRSSQAAGVFGRALPFSDGHFAAVSRENPRRGDVGTAPVSEKWNRAAAGGKGGRVDRREGNGNRKRLTNDVGRRADTELGSRQREGAEAAQTREVVAVQPAERRLHALVVVGTGMLRGLSLALAEEGHMVSVVARTPSRLQSLTDAAKDFSGGINPLPLDYRDGARLQNALRRAVERFGPFGLAVCWIHSTAPEALRQVAGFIADTSKSCRLFHVRGSAAANPLTGSWRPPEWTASYPNIQYRQVILGFVIEGGRSRWLTHAEISGGVLDAVRNDRLFSIVGTVEPWSLRP